MPTKKKRVGFIPREEVMNIIDRLSNENNLSISKIISILVEEALTSRGIYNKSSKASSLYHKQTTLIKQTDNEIFDLQTYKKFLSFLKFQEMMEEYDT